MNIGRCVTLVLALTPIAQRALAQAVHAGSLLHGELSFDANATMGAFTGTTTTVNGKLSAAPSLSQSHGFVEAPSASLTTHNGHRDRDMASSLEIEKYPVLRFDLDSVLVDGPPGDSIPVHLQGRFTLHGQTHPVSIPGWVWLGASQARARGSIRLNVKDYGVGGLSKMLGMLKMDAMITVRFDVSFTT